MTTGHDVVLLLYQPFTGKPLAPVVRWNSAGVQDDVPVGAAYALVNFPPSVVPRPIVVIAGKTTLNDGSADTFVVAFVASMQNQLDGPKPGTMVPGFPAVFHTPGRSNTPVAIKATRDGIYVTGTTRSSLDPTRDAKMFLAKFDLPPISFPVGQQAVPRWVDISSTDGNAEAATAMDFIIDTNPANGTWVYYGGERAGSDGFDLPQTAFVTVQIQDVVGASGPNPVSRWYGWFNRPAPWGAVPTATTWVGVSI